jgi:isoleucyl-tRNA synthetase
MKENMKYRQVESSPNFSEIEEKVIAFWKNEKIFEKSVEIRESKISGKNNEFIFYDGPPFANGLPHYGHLLTGFIKDTYARYQTNKGKRVERRFGWDCHGLPAEMGAEKELSISGRSEISAFGIDKFNAHCKTSVMKFTSEWEKYVTRQARWVDFENSYKTMDTNFMESVLWAFKELYNKGLVYESMRVMPYSWACETPLSNFETRLDNSYRERADKAVTVSFTLDRINSSLPEGFKEYKILAWTTTPWTLPSNLALAVGPDIEYICASRDEICYIIGKFAFEKYKKDLKIEEENIISIIKGSDLKEITYKPIFSYFQDNKNSFKILVGDFVLQGDGTGIVHMAPGFGEDDQILCQKNGIDLVCPVDNAGKFTSEVSDFQGYLVFDANDKIIIKLKEQGSWIKTEQYLHNYPHCWRTDTPLIYKAVPSWYVKVTDFKDRMVELNQQINWIPYHIKDGMFGKWLENARDWSISRNRFWGTPIPIWKSDDPKYPRIDVYGSIEELSKDFGVEIKDLHRPFIDSLTRPNPDDPTGKSMMRRVEDVFDCWFESGSMPYGQAHYPFENKEWFEEHFPADFIVEYSAQTRGWFYTLMVLSTALFDRPPFLNCICHGVILDSTGQKLSKRLNNFADPMDLFAKYGADSLRYTMLSSTVSKGQELLIDKDGKMVHEVLRLYIKPIWNAYNFFTLYANADSIDAKIDYSSSNPLDIYILGKLKLAVHSIEKSLDNYDTQAAYQYLHEFFEVLNNWYIRRSRTRYWKSEKDNDKQTAYNTLFTCLEHMMRAISSLLPLISEEIYQGIYGVEYNPENSVHLKLFPDLSEIALDHKLIQEMDKVRDICSSALFIRNTSNIRVRQPLSELKIITTDIGKIDDFKSIIQDEINVKKVLLLDNLKDFAETKLNINFQVLGKRIPAKIKDIISASKSGDWSREGDKLLISGEELNSDEYQITLVPKHIESARALQSNNGIVILDLNITQDLLLEGYARDIIRSVQQLRKDSALNVTDRIILNISSSSSHIVESIKYFSALIEEQTLSKIDENKPNQSKSAQIEIDEGIFANISINKI